MEDERRGPGEWREGGGKEEVALGEDEVEEVKSGGRGREGGEETVRGEGVPVLLKVREVDVNVIVISAIVNVTISENLMREDQQKIMEIDTEEREKKETEKESKEVEGGGGGGKGGERNKKFE